MKRFAPPLRRPICLLICLPICLPLWACSRELTIALPFQSGEQSALLAIKQKEKLEIYAFDARASLRISLMTPCM